VENPKTVSDVVFLTELFENALILTKPQPHVEIPPSIPQHTKKDTMTMNELGELLQPVANCDLPAPAAAMAVVAHGLADFPNPPQEAIMMTTLQSGGDDTSSESEATPRPADEKSISRKKRAYINDTEEVKQAASEWAIHRDSSDPTAETKAEEVDRHCKIRFVERLSNVIGTTEALVSTVPDPVLIEKTSTTIVADEENISDMDSEKLDDLLDSLLVRIVESLVEITDSSTELNEELNAPDRSGFTLLHYAALYNLQSLIPVLLSRGVNPDTTTLAGKLTPLHLACGAGNWAIVELLVRHGCALKMKDSFGATPADHAFRSGFPGISKWLKDKIDDQKSKISESIKEADESTSFDDASMSSSGHNKALMQSAFHNLNLKDKIAFKLMLEKRQRDAASRIPTSETIMEVEENELNGDASLPRNGNTSSVMKQIEDDDVGSVISTMDRESLDIAMKFMNEEELNELQSSNVDEDMKNWIISRNYLSLKKASENLRETVDKRKKQTATQPSPNHSSTASSVESKVLGDDKETRRQLKNMQSEALAALVLRKNLMKLAEKDANNKTSKSVNSV
jgi:ankyrin repeat protein